MILSLENAFLGSKSLHFFLDVVLSSLWINNIEDIALSAETRQAET